MPGQRAKGQKQVLTMFDEKFLSEIERSMRGVGYSDRSKFIRDAVFEKLQRAGIRVNYTLAMAPSRLGKIQQKRKNLEREMESPVLNEDASASQPAPPMTATRYAAEKPRKKRKP